MAAGCPPCSRQPAGAAWRPRPAAFPRPLPVQRQRRSRWHSSPGCRAAAAPAEFNFVKKLFHFYCIPRKSCTGQRAEQSPRSQPAAPPAPSGAAPCARRGGFITAGGKINLPRVSPTPRRQSLSFVLPAAPWGRGGEKKGFVSWCVSRCFAPKALCSCPWKSRGGRFALPPPCRVPTGAGVTPRVLRLRCFLGEKRFQGLSPASLGGEGCGSRGEGEVKKGLEKQKKEAKTQGVFGPEPREPLSLGSRLDARPRAALGTECGCSRFTPGPSAGRGPGGCGGACRAEIRVGAWEDKVLRSRWRAASLGAGGCF